MNDALSSALARIDALERRIDALEYRQAEVKVRRRLSIEDVLTLRRALPAVYRVAGTAYWTIQDLQEYVDEDPSLGPVLAENGFSNAKTSGKLLARAAGLAIEGLRIVRCGEDRNGVVWKLEPVSADFKSARNPHSR